MFLKHVEVICLVLFLVAARCWEHGNQFVVSVLTWYVLKNELVTLYGQQQTVQQRCICPVVDIRLEVCLVCVSHQVFGVIL